MKNWNNIYRRNEQLNQYPFTEVISFCMKNFKLGNTKVTYALDVGTGSGVHSDFLTQFGFKVHGIDGSKFAISNAKKKFPNKNITYECIQFDKFNSKDRKFDFVLDRLSTTHSSKIITIKFYQNLKYALKSKAKVLWSGFCWDNSARKLGVESTDGSYSNFKGGALKKISPAVFFKKSDIKKIFNGYTLSSIRKISDINTMSRYNNSVWLVEAINE